MTDTPKSAPEATEPATPTDVTDATGREREPKLWQIVVIALVAIIFTAIFLGINGFLSRTIWPNDFFTTRRWTIPAGVLVFSLIVGLAQRYLRAPTVIHGGVVNAFKGKDESDYTTFPGALLSSYASLLSGASVGPEAPVGILVGDVAAWIRSKLRISRRTAQGFDLAALASAYNGIIGSPLFTGVLATELGVGGSNALAFLAWNLLAGVIGFLFYTLLGLPVFAKYIAFTPINQLTVPYILWAIVLGFIGVLVALFVALSYRFIQTLTERIFHDRVILRVFAAAVIIAIVVFFVPQVMFAGETQIFPMIDNPASYGVLALLGLGILKLLLLALSVKSGYLGGPTFPILFSCTMFGLALSLLFPGVPVSILVLCIEAATLTMALGAPLTSILLVAVIGTADANEVALLVLSSLVALIVGERIKRLMAQRRDRSTKTQQATA
ncbi:MAG TPA: chloride channel protein [Ktedonobacterales bacterium]|nr:chloride channel protein [Ktedonobacterales bacterium]